MRRLLPLFLLAGCAKDLPPEQACLEARTAIAARSDECTGDPAISAALIEAFDAETTCLLPDLPPDDPLLVDPLPTYECALVTRNLACELALEYGEDLGAWLDSTPTCGLILEGP